jgi:hypothetical protein
MKQLKAFIAGIVVGILLGLWFGVNLGKDRPIFSNPFAEDTVQDKIKKTGEKLIEKSGEALEKGGKALQDTVKENTQ